MSAEHARVQRKLDEFRDARVGDRRPRGARGAGRRGRLDRGRARRAARRRSRRKLAELEEAAPVLGQYDAGDAVVTVHAGARRHRLAGLGRDAAAHGDALGRAARLQGRAEGGSARGRRPASSRPPSSRTARTPTACSRPRRACTGWCGSRRSTPRRAGTPRSRWSRWRRSWTTRWTSRSTTTTSRSTPTAPPAPAASTSTRPTRRCGSPTGRRGIVVQCQNERSQSSNKATAMAMLQSQPARARGAEAPRGDREGEGRGPGRGLGLADPLLRAAALHDGQGPPHELRDGRRPAACWTAISTASCGRSCCAAPGWTRRERQRSREADKQKAGLGPQACFRCCFLPGFHPVRSGAYQSRPDGIARPAPCKRRVPGHRRGDQRPRGRALRADRGGRRAGGRRRAARALRVARARRAAAVARHRALHGHHAGDGGFGARAGGGARAAGRAGARKGADRAQRQLRPARAEAGLRAGGRGLVRSAVAVHRARWPRASRRSSRQRKLVPLAESLGIEVDGAHRALVDAETCARVFCALFPRICAHAHQRGRRAGARRSAAAGGEAAGHAQAARRAAGPQQAARRPRRLRLPGPAREAALRRQVGVGAQPRPLPLLRPGGLDRARRGRGLQAHELRAGRPRAGEPPDQGLAAARQQAAEEHRRLALPALPLRPQLPGARAGAGTGRRPGGEHRPACAARPRPRS